MAFGDIDVCNCLPQLCHLKSHKTYLSPKFVCNAERGRGRSDKSGGKPHTHTEAIAELIAQTPTRVRGHSEARLLMDILHLNYQIRDQKIAAVNPSITSVRYEAN